MTKFIVIDDPLPDPLPDPDPEKLNEFLRWIHEHSKGGKIKPLVPQRVIDDFDDEGHPV